MTENICNRIKRLKIEKNWSNTQLSAESELPQLTIDRIVAGVCEPTLSEMKKIAKAFKIPIDFLAEDSVHILYNDTYINFYCKYSLLNDLDDTDQEIILQLIERLHESIDIEQDLQDRL